MLKLFKIISEIKVIGVPKLYIQQWGGDMYALVTKDKKVLSYRGTFSTGYLKDKFLKIYPYSKEELKYIQNNYIPHKIYKGKRILTIPIKNIFLFDGLADYKNQEDIGIILEIRIVPGTIKLIAIKSFPRDEKSKSYRVKLSDEEEFTIHKHKTFSTLYPSFRPTSPKYLRIIEFLKNRGVPYKEIRNAPHTSSIRIDNKFILFQNDKIT